MTPSGIETAIFRLVVQCLNQLKTASVLQTNSRLHQIIERILHSITWPPTLVLCFLALSGCVDFIRWSSAYKLQYVSTSAYISEAEYSKTLQYACNIIYFVFYRLIQNLILCNNSLKILSLNLFVKACTTSEVKDAVSCNPTNCSSAK